MVKPPSPPPLPFPAVKIAMLAIQTYTKPNQGFKTVDSGIKGNQGLLIGRPGIREIQAVPSTAHGMLKFLVDGGVVTIFSTILMPNGCATITATSKDSMKKIEGGQENLKVAIHHDFPDQEVALGGMLSIKGRTALCALAFTEAGAGA
ncbi:hypothetical protein Tco_1409218 [Tanacetum coccineum]